MRSTTWLAMRLGLSITTIERLRAHHSQDLPPCCTIGKSKRYDEQVVEQWIREAGGEQPAQTQQTTRTGKLPPNLTPTTQEGASNANA